ncbi:DUF4259 domain-containing protein [Vibrio profundum]|uniref:DUF4259 domain-containing protein n=1 Tax=Vibrio profundum TaxID=2910247 RepID=UPI003D0D9BDB
MGAWGVDIFDDDTACEIIEEAIEEKNTLEHLVTVALSVAKSEYLEYTECHQIIVASALANSLINGKMLSVLSHSKVS